MIRARELRFVLVVDDYEAAAHLFRHVFDLDVVMDLEGQGGRGVILEVPRPPSRSWIPTTGGWSTSSRPASRSTNACGSPVQVDDLAEADLEVSDAGGEPVAAAVETPWGDRNQRFRMSDGLQLTLFETK